MASASATGEIVGHTHTHTESDTEIWPPPLLSRRRFEHISSFQSFSLSLPVEGSVAIANHRAKDVGSKPPFKLNTPSNRSLLIVLYCVSYRIQLIVKEVKLKIEKWSHRPPKTQK